MEKIYLRNAAIVKKVGDKLFIASEGEGVYDEKTVIAEGATVPRELRHRFADVINVKDFGARGDGVTDDTAAIRAAYDYAVSKGGGSIFFPAGRYRVTEEINCYRRASGTNSIPIVFEGDDLEITYIVVDFTGAGKACFRSEPSRELVASLGYWPRSSPLSFQNLQFVRGASTSPENMPGYIWVYGHGNSTLSNLKFVGGNNTHLRSLSAQNVRLFNVTSWYGGKTFTYKDTAGITFSTTEAGQITASSNIFSAADVGKKLLLTPVSAGTLTSVVTISSVESGTACTVSGPIFTFAEVKVVFEPASVSMVSGSAICTANAPAFVAGDVGRIVFIGNAKKGLHGDAVLRAEIVRYIDEYTVELSEAAENTVENSILTCPAVEFFNPYYATDTVSSDVKFYMLHIEHYRGLGLMIGRADSYQMFGGKIHGTTTETSDNVSTFGMWVDDVDGSFQLTFDTGCSTTGYFVRASNLNACTIFDNVFARLVRGQIFIREDAMTSLSGCVVIKGFNSFYLFSTPNDLKQSFNEPSRVKFFGVVQAADGTQIYPYLNNTTHFDNADRLIHDGDLVTGDVTVRGSNSAGITLEQVNSRKWDIRAASGNLYIEDLTGAKRRLGFSSSSGAVFPPITKAQSLGNGMYLWTEVFAATASINTSDAREKTSVTDPNEALMRAWGKVDFKAFQFTDAVEKKGEAARIHFGVIAQQVAEAFASEGLDVSRYALFCYDKWEDEYEDVEVVDVEAVLDEQGNEVTPAVTHTEKRLVTPAGDRYGIRYSEALALECAYQRWRLSKLEEKMASIS